ncbi:hypothetical protein ColKHC_14282 [Colletotrichum higginsianum]|nr:hypothetical protein ColKHC_14282 [Colletotrichum higginsianum]
MSANNRVRVEAENDVASSLAQLRQAQALHAQQQLGPDAVPAIWSALRRQFWRHAVRRHLAAGLVPLQDDVRDFAPFLRHQLSLPEIEFSLFVVFRDHRSHMRSNAVGAELRRRYNAFKGNAAAAAKSEDDCAFKLGTTVLRSVTALKTLNSLLNPRAGASFSPADVFLEVRRQMLLRNQDVDEMPEPTPADVATAASARRLRPHRLQETRLAFGRPPARRPCLHLLDEEEENEDEEENEAEKHEAENEEEPEGESKDQRGDDGAGGLFPLPHPLLLSLPLLRPETPGREGPRHRDPSPRLSSPAPLRSPVLGIRSPDHRPRTPLPPPASSPNGDVFHTPLAVSQSRPPSPRDILPLADTPPPARAAPAGAAPAASPFDLEEDPVGVAHRYLDIVRQIRDMPEPRGSILWRCAIYTLRQAAESVAAWCELVLDEDAIGEQ